MSKYTIYDPVIERDHEVVGGPWCFSIDKKRAYIAFPNQELAKKFVHLWGGSFIADVIEIEELGGEREELLDDVEHLLFITNEADMESLVKDVDKFPYNHFLIPRYLTMVH